MSERDAYLDVLGNSEDPRAASLLKLAKKRLARRDSATGVQPNKDPGPIPSEGEATVLAASATGPLPEEMDRQTLADFGADERIDMVQP